MLLGLKAVSLRIGTTVLLDAVDFSLEERERVALVGRNGAGKSTLFRILAGQQAPDDGLVIRQDGLRVSCLQQAVPEGEELTVAQVVAMGLGEDGAATMTVQQLSELPFDQLSEAQQLDLAAAQAQLTEHHAWHLASDIEQILGRFHLLGSLPFASL